MKRGEWQSISAIKPVRQSMLGLIQRRSCNEETRTFYSVASSSTEGIPTYLMFKVTAGLEKRNLLRVRLG